MVAIGPGEDRFIAMASGPERPCRLTLFGLWRASWVAPADVLAIRQTYGPSRMPSRAAARFPVVAITDPHVVDFPGYDNILPSAPSYETWLVTPTTQNARAGWSRPRGST